MTDALTNLRRGMDAKIDLKKNILAGVKLFQDDSKQKQTNQQVAERAKILQRLQDELQRKEDQLREMQDDIRLSAKQYELRRNGGASDSWWDWLKSFLV